MAEINITADQDIDFSDNTYAPSGKPELYAPLHEELQKSRMSFAANRNMVADYAFLKSGVDGTNVVDEFQAGLSQLEAGADIQTLRNGLKEQRVAQVEEELLGMIAENSSSRDPEISAMVTDVAMNLRERAEEHALEFLDDDGYELLKAETFNPDGAFDIDSQYEQSRQYANRITQESFGERGIYDTVTDVAESLIPFGFTKDINEMMGSFVGGQDTFLAMAAEYQSLPPLEQRFQFKNVILPAITEAADDNAMAAASLVALLHDRDNFAEVLTSSVLDISVVGPVVLGKVAGKFGVSTSKKVYESAKSSFNKAKDYSKMNNDEAASTISQVSSKINDAPTGVSKLDAAHNANPLETTVMSKTSLDGLADTMQKSRKTVMKRLVDEITESTGETLTRQGRLNLIKGLRKDEESLKLADNAFKAAMQSLAKKPNKNMGKIAKIQRDRVKELTARIKVNKDKLDTKARRRQADANKASLERGEIPTNLAARVEELASMRTQQVLSMKAGAAAKEGETLKASALQMANGSEGIANKILSESTQGGKLLDNPELYGVSDEYARAVEAAHITSLRKTVDEVNELAPELLSQTQKDAIRESVVDSLRVSAKQEGKEISIGEATLTRDGFSVKYKQDGIDDTIDYNYTVSDLGVFDSVATRIPERIVLARNVLSPQSIMERVKDGIVRESKFAQDQAARAGNEITKSFKNIEKGLSKDELRQIDSLLMAGDEGGEVFKFNDLLSGTVEVAGIGKVPMSRKVVDGYYAKRAFFDELHSFRNDMSRRQLQQLGMRNTSYVDKTGVTRNLLGRELTNEQFNLADNALVFNANAAVTGQSEWMLAGTGRAMMKDQGYKVVRLLEPKKHGKQDVTHAIVLNDDLGKVSLGALPKQVLNYSAGYVPRIYRPGYWFVKARGEKSTLYAAETREQAEKWARQATDENTDGISFSAHSDREFDPIEQMIEGSNGFGGLYTGSRKSTPLMVKTGEDTFVRPDRMSTNDATERYIQNISNTMTMNDYRTATVREWENTVRALLKEEGKEDIASRINFRSPSTGLSSKLDKEMEHSREYISRVMRVPSNEEKSTANFMANLADKMYQNPILGGKARDAVLANIHSEPSRALKGLTFNLHLGWFNVRQLFVQAQNASIAMSVSPQHAPAAFLETAAMRAAIFSDNPDVWRSVAKANPLMNADDFVKSVGDFKKSGLIDGIIRQGDWDATAQGVGNASMKLLRQGAAAGRVFFQEGELASRMMSWNIAKRRLGKGASAKELSDETTRLTMDMSSANSATWQNNALGIPTQFLQVQAKFIENLLPKAMGGSGKWTAKEKASAFAGQVALYGTVGIPIVEDITSYLAEQNGVSAQEFREQNPTVADSLEEGFAGVLLSSLGIESNISTSASLVSGFFQDNAAKNAVVAMSDLFIDGATDITPIDLLGANANSIKRSGDVLTTLYDNVKTFWTTPSFDNLGSIAIEELDAIVSMTSTWSNAKKGWFLHEVGVRGSQGQTHIAPTAFDDLNLQTQIARAIGFTTDIEQSYWDNKQHIKDFDKNVQSYQEDYRKAYNNFLLTGNMNRLQSQLAAVNTFLTDTEVRKLKRRVRDSILNPKSGADKDLEKAFKAFLAMENGTLPAATVKLREQL